MKHWALYVTSCRGNKLSNVQKLISFPETNKKPLHFLDISELDGSTLHKIIDSAKHIKEKLLKGEEYKPLKGTHLAMLFEKPSTRTRVSFEVGINQLGGHAILLDQEKTQMGSSESVADTARVLSRFVDLIMIRCYEHSILLELGKHASVPVINGLTNDSHPCQVMADIMTFEEHRGSIEGKTIAWVGDGDNNMAWSWIHAAARFGFKLRIAAPRQLQPSDEILDWVKNNPTDLEITADPREAVDGADAVNTDCWVSMGDTDKDKRHTLLAPYQVNNDLMACAKKEAVFMHCLPAHRGEEVTDSVIDGKQSIVFDEAENRLHIQKAIMCWCVFGGIPS